MLKQYFGSIIAQHPSVFNAKNRSAHYRHCGFYYVRQGTSYQKNTPVSIVSFVGTVLI